MRAFVLPTIFTALVLAAIVATFLIMARASKGYDRARQRRIESGLTAPCSTCRSPMRLVGIQEFKVSAEGEAADPEVGAALGSAGGRLALEVHRCPTCRRIELFLPPSAG